MTYCPPITHPLPAYRRLPAYCTPACCPLPTAHCPPFYSGAALGGVATMPGEPDKPDVPDKPGTQDAPDKPVTPRMTREQRTVEAMIELYCQGHHEPVSRLCRECRELVAYSDRKLEKCPFQEAKSVCAKCLIHCYEPTMRERIRTVMRYSGPRMVRYHPVMAIRHLLDKRREAPDPKSVS